MNNTGFKTRLAEPIMVGSMSLLFRRFYKIVDDVKLGYAIYDVELQTVEKLTEEHAFYMTIIDEIK